MTCNFAVIGAFLFSLAPLARAAYVTEVLADNPVGYWRFEDASSGNGATAFNWGTTGATNDGTYQGGVTTATSYGLLGNAAGFNGVSAYVDLGFDMRDALNGATAITVEAWVKNDTLPPGSSTSDFIYRTVINGTDTGARLAINFADPRMNLGGRAQTGNPFVSGGANYGGIDAWRHVVGVMDFANDEIRVYIDGVGTTIAANFSSPFIAGGTDTHADSIGANEGLSDWDRFFDGLIDEVAVYDYALGGERILAHFNAGSPTDPPEPQPLWKSQVAFSDASTGVYLGSPSVARLDANTLVASHDYFGPNAPKNAAGWLNSSAIHRSTDNGETWSHATDITGSFWPTVFEHDGAVYLIGENARYESIVIRKSTDGGLTWSEPTDAQNGLLRPGGSGFTAPNYFSGNNNMLIAEGKIYRAFCDRTTPTWADGYNTFVMWADLDSDLLDADSWHSTNKLSFPAGVFASGPGGVPGWQEGSVVQAPNGEIWNILRVNAGINADRDTAAIVTLSADASTVTFDAATGFINLPGGSAGNFTVRRDPKTGLYLSLVNNIVNPEIQRQRNYLSLAVSEDLIHWELVATLLADDQGLSVQDSAAQTGFQYVDWHFDGDDLIYIVRTAYDGAHDYHDSNRITFHVLENYLSVIADIPEPGATTLFGIAMLAFAGRRRQ